MRPIMFVLAVLASCGPAAAQSWREYQYPDHFFTVAFPDDPQIETTKYQIADDRLVEARVYSVQHDDAVFKVTVAELADTGLEEGVVIDHAIRKLTAGGEVKVNIPHRINRVFGRQLSIAGPDGIRTMAAVFDYNGQFYQIEGIALPAGNDATADVIRFVQSLTFTGAGSNRSEERIRAGRGACGGADVSAPEGTVAGDSRRSEIRCRRQQMVAALVTSLNSGDLAGAQQAYSSLSSQLQNCDQAGFRNPDGPFARAMIQIGKVLQNGDLTGAQQAVSSLQRGRRTRQP